MEENLNPGTSGTGTESEAATEQTADPVTESEQNSDTVSAKPEKTFTQSQVNDLMTKRVQRSHNSFFTRYGVKDLKELDELFGKSVDYDKVVTERDELSQKYGDLETQHKDLNKRYAYKIGNVDESKIADIENYFKGKGIDIDENTLIEEIKTHPDWVHKVATIRKLGAEVEKQDESDARAEASRIFGVTLR